MKILTKKREILGIKKTKSLGREIIVRLMLVFLITTTVNGVMVFENQTRRSFAQAKEMGRELLLYENRTLQNFYAYDWLPNYWYEHRDEIKKSIQKYEYQSDAYYDEKIRLENMLGGEGIKVATKEQVEQLSKEDQQSFATICYVKLEAELRDISIHFDLNRLYTLHISENEDGTYRSTYLFRTDTGCEDGQTEEDEEPAIGESYDWQGKEYPVLEKLYHGEVVKEWIDIHHRTRGSKQYLIYNPKWTEKGKLDYVMVLEVEDKSIQGEIIGQIIVIELLSTIILLTSILLIYLVFRRSVVRPVLILKKAVRSFAKDKDVDRAIECLEEIQETNEIGTLKEDISALTVEMVRYTEEIKHMASEKERIDTELNLAATIQANMLPQDFDLFSEQNHLDVYASMIPAKEVGGDFYDFIKIDDDHIMFEIADVSGKGVPAALFMMVAKELIKQHALMNPDPAQIFTSVNNQLCENNQECLFVTAWIGVYEISTGIVCAANAGHEYPAISRNYGEFSLFRDEHGLCLGLMPDAEYCSYELKLEKGDTLFLYTDGVTEAIDENEAMFGEKQMLMSLSARKNEELAAILNGIRTDIKEFEHEASQFDDITMLAVRAIK